MNKPKSFAERREIIARVEARVARGEDKKAACLAEGTTLGTLKGWKSRFKNLEGLDRLNEEEARLRQDAHDRRGRGEDE